MRQSSALFRLGRKLLYLLWIIVIAGGFGLSYLGSNIGWASFGLVTVQDKLSVLGVGVAIIAAGLALIGTGMSELFGSRRFDIIYGKLDAILTKLDAIDGPNVVTEKNRTVKPNPSKPPLWKESPSIVLAIVLNIVVITVADSYIIFTSANLGVIPSQIAPAKSLQILQALIQTNGVLVGFAGAVFAVVLRGSDTVKSWLFFIQSGFIFVSILFFLGTIVQAFLSMASDSPLTSTNFGVMLSYTVNGVVTLFVGVIASHELKSISMRFGIGQQVKAA